MLASGLLCSTGLLQRLLLFQLVLLGLPVDLGDHFTAFFALCLEREVVAAFVRSVLVLTRI